MESRGGLKAFADAIGLVKNGSVLCIGVACKQQKPLKWLNISGAFSFLPFEYDQRRGVQS